MRKRVTVLLSEENELYTGLVREAFQAFRHRFQVVSCASNTSEIVAALRETQPRVAIISVDLQNGPLAGVQILPEIRKISLDTRTLIINGIFLSGAGD
jgi:ActR/RegA family two-component response regulator